MATLAQCEADIKSTDYHDQTLQCQTGTPADLVHAESHHYCKQQLDMTIMARVSVLSLQWAESGGGGRSEADNYAWNDIH